MKTTCPLCARTIFLEEPIEISRLVFCSHCGAGLEVVWLYPLSLAPAKPFPVSDRKENLPREKFPRTLRRLRGKGS